MNIPLWLDQTCTARKTTIILGKHGGHAEGKKDFGFFAPIYSERCWFKISSSCHKPSFTNQKVFNEVKCHYFEAYLVVLWACTCYICLCSMMQIFSSDLCLGALLICDHIFAIFVLSIGTFQVFYGWVYGSCLCLLLAKLRPWKIMPIETLYKSRTLVTLDVVGLLFWVIVYNIFQKKLRTPLLIYNLGSKLIWCI